MQWADGEVLLAEFYQALEKGQVTAMAALPADARHIVQEIRDRVVQGLPPAKGAVDLAKLGNKKLTGGIMCLHMWVVQSIPLPPRAVAQGGREEGAAAGEKDRRRGVAAYPVAKMGRAHINVDAFVAEALCARLGRPYKGLASLFQLDEQAWKTARKARRKALRRTTRKGLGGSAKAPKARKRRCTKARRAVKRKRAHLKSKADWSKARTTCGIGKLPSGEVTGVTTDGVSMCIRFVSVVRKAPRKPLPETKEERAAKRKDDQAVVSAAVRELKARHGDNLREIGDDRGRANVDTTAEKVGDGFVVHKLTREWFLEASQQRKYRQWLTARKAAHPEVTAAETALSDGGTGGWKARDADGYWATLRAYMVHRPALQAFYMEESHAGWCMRLHRKKRSAANNFWRQVLGYERRPVLLAVGDAKFASTGRGEVSVPVKGSLQLVNRLLKEMRQDRGVEGMLVKVDERMTTLGCYECGAIMEHKHDEHGKQVRDVMLCGSAECRGLDHSPMPRDRDANAAKNILRIAEALALGHERPKYLVCRPRQRRRRA